MIEEEDCCDNCEEGEPCCDEELAVQFEVVTEGVTVDIERLGRHLCCPNRFHHIYDVMHGLSKEELIKLRDDLRSYSPTNSLHHHLDAAFCKATGE